MGCHKCVWIFLLVALPFTLFAQSAAERDVRVCLRLEVQPDHGVLMQSQSIAKDLFRRAGVRMQWSCEQPAGSGTDWIPVELVDYDDPRFDETVLGFARPYARSGTRAVVFYGRMSALISGQPMHGSALLAYVLVHEVGHVLSGRAVHTDRGVMRANWSLDDLRLIFAHRLSLSPDDVELMGGHAAEQPSSGRLVTVRVPGRDLP